MPVNVTCEPGAADGRVIITPLQFTGAEPEQVTPENPIGKEVKLHAKLPDGALVAPIFAASGEPIVA